MSSGLPVGSITCRQNVRMTRQPRMAVLLGRPMKSKTRLGASRSSEAAKDLCTIVLTVGHSTRTIEEFVQLLQAHGVTEVVDVRTIPQSRHNPQFNKGSLPASLKKVGLRYLHMPELGGLRHARPDSRNTGWRNASFRGYADYMQTPEFAQAIEQLIALAKQERIAIMCAEAVPWRCHRSLIGDALLVRGIRVEDIMTPTRRQIHTFTPFAETRGHTITYPPSETKPSVAPSPSKRTGKQ